MKKILLGSAIGAGLLYYFLSSEPQVSPATNAYLDRKTILAILSDLYKEIKVLAKIIAHNANKIKENSLIMPTPDQLRSILNSDFSYDPHVRLIEYQIYQQFNTNEEIVNKTLENCFSEDKTVQSLIEKIKKTVSQALEGFALDEAKVIPYELTGLLALQIISEIFKCELYLIYKKNQWIKAKNDQFDDEFRDLDDEIYQEEMKCKINAFKLFGFDMGNDEVNGVIRQSIVNFSAIDVNFKEEIKKIERKFNKTVSDIFELSISAEKIEVLKKKYEEYIN